MKQRAQAGLEYLVTYGWALVLVASFVGVLVFVVGQPLSEANFSSSDPSKLLVKGGSVGDGIATVKLQNITGGKITVQSVAAISGYLNCSSSNTEAVVGAGGILEIVCTAPIDSTKGEIEIAYIDEVGFLQNTLISGGSETATAPPSNENSDFLCSDGYDNDADGFTDCFDPDCDGFGGCALISACPYAISQAGTYLLGENLSTSGTCITINADDVLLDCAGSSITNATQANVAIEVLGDRATIRNCTLSGFEKGINLNGSDDTELSGNSISGAFYGIYVGSSNAAKILNNDVSNNSYTGVKFVTSDGAGGGQITGNIFDSDRTGLDGWTWNNYSVTDNTFNGNTLAGIDCTRCSGNTISDNAITNNGVGLSLDYSSSPGSTFTENTITGSTRRGMDLDSAHWHTITNNFVCSDLGTYDILCDGSHGGDISGNTATRIDDYRCGIVAGPLCP